MLSRLDPATDRFLTELAEINRRIETAQRQVSSGKRISSASDDPDQISNMLQIRTELAQTEQTLSNLGRVQTEVDAAEQSLQAAVKVLERARVLGLQGANGTQEPGQRLTIADEVETLLQQMVGLSRTTVEARYIFSGDSDAQEPFSLNLTEDDPVSPYLGGNVTREVLHPAGSSFQVARNAEEIFDNPDPARNAFQAINNLRLGLRDNDQAAIEAALQQIESAENHLNTQLSFYGSAQNQVAEALEFGYKQSLRLETSLSGIQDADVTEAILELNQAQYQQEAALAVKARAPRISLFDFLR